MLKPIKSKKPGNGGRTKITNKMIYDLLQVTINRLGTVEKNQQKDHQLLIDVKSRLDEHDKMFKEHCLN